MTISSAAEALTHRAPPRSAAAETWLLLGIVFTFGLHGALAFLQPVNWDEFRYLADVHLFVRGDLSEWLQTFHVRLFAWLAWLPGDEIDQILVARTVMLGAEAVTAWLIYRCGRAFMEREPALLAVLSFLAADFVLRHGASFRSDPIALLFLVGALAILLAPAADRLRFAAAGALAAMAALFTIKAAFFLPTLAVCAWWRAADDRPKVTIAAAAGVLVLLLLAGLHAMGLPNGQVGAGVAVASHGFDKTVADAGLLPRGSEMLTSLVRDPWLWLLLAAGLAFATRALGLAQDRARTVALLSFAAPLLALLFYRNAFPYFYPFILAPAVLFAGHAAARVRRDDLYPAAAALLALFASLHAIRTLSPVLSVQRAYVEAVHAMFPEPVPYLDRASMIAGFSQAGFFMSSWGMENYREAGRPVMAGIVAREAPVFVIADGPLAAALEGEAAPGLRLLSADVETLRTNFVPHWGRIWIAGKRFAGGASETRFDLPIEGRYRVEAEALVRIDGRTHQPGDVIRLERGPHSMTTPRPALLRYATRPAGRVPPAGPLYGDLR